MNLLNLVTACIFDGDFTFTSQGRERRKEKKHFKDSYLKAQQMFIIIEKHIM